MPHHLSSETSELYGDLYGEGRACSESCVKKITSKTSMRLEDSLPALGICGGLCQWVEATAADQPVVLGRNRPLPSLEYGTAGESDWMAENSEVLASEQVASKPASVAALVAVVTEWMLALPQTAAAAEEAAKHQDDPPGVMATAMEAASPPGRQWWKNSRPARRQARELMTMQASPPEPPDPASKRHDL